MWKKGGRKLKDARRVGFEVRKLDHVFSRNLEAGVRAAGIDEMTLMHGWIMKYLYENKEKDIYQKDIEKHCAVGRSTVTNVVQLMEKKGLIRRESVPNDARLKKVVLTEKGMSGHRTVENLITEINNQMVEGISDEDLENFLRVAVALRKNIENQTQERKEGGSQC